MGLRDRPKVARLIGFGNEGSAHRLESVSAEFEMLENREHFYVIHVETFRLGPPQEEYDFQE